MLDWWLGIAAAAERTALATALRSSSWGYPAVEAVHIWGLAVFIGTTVAFDLRLLGVSSNLPADLLAPALERHSR